MLTPAALSGGVSPHPAPAAVGLSLAGRVAGLASRWLLHPSLRSRRGGEQSRSAALPATMSTGKGMAGDPAGSLSPERWDGMGGGGGDARAPLGTRTAVTLCFSAPLHCY